MDEDAPEHHVKCQEGERVRVVVVVVVPFDGGLRFRLSNIRFALCATGVERSPVGRKRRNVRIKDRRDNRKESVLFGRMKSS